MSAKQSEKENKINNKSFVIGIGSSAGGLEALQLFIKGLNNEVKDATYLVAQHLSPQHKSMLVELLGKNDNVEVVVAEHGTTPEIGKMYITPPNADITLENFKIRLSEPVEGAGPKPSVDKLFKSMSKDVDIHAIGVILSGTGSDGAAGIQAIRTEGGITVAQNPDTAKYDGMPQSAIKTDCIDAIMDPEDIGEYLAKVIKTGKKRQVLVRPLKNELETILMEVEAATGLSFYGYKETTLKRRLERRMVANGINSLNQYLKFIRSNSEEPAQLAQDFLISVTEFFRDKHAYDSLLNLIKTKLDKTDTMQSMRIWSVGCATGEEAYSLAIMCAEVLGGAEQLYRHRIQIFATDIDSNALSVAREGCYPTSSVSNMPEEIRNKYFVASGDKYKVVKPIKDIVLFSKHNILENPPFSRIDLLVCRNVLIYFSNPIQEKVFSIFHYSLVKSGIMFLGKSESTGKSESLFKKIERPGNFFSKRPTSLSTPMGLKFNSRGSGIKAIESKKDAERNHQSHLLSSILASLTPNSVLVNQSLDILHVYGDVSPFLKMQSGKPSMNLAANIVQPFKQEVRVFSFKVVRENKKAQTTTRPIEINGKIHEACIHFYPIDLPDEEKMLLVSFEHSEVSETRVKDTSEGDKDHPNVAMLEQELQATQEHLQTVIEELETLNEELQSTNEELQSSNEELHSTNEELETSNEELQSTNEELTTVNDELSQKKTELENGHLELLNIQNAVNFPILRLNDNLQIARSNEAAQELLNLTDDDNLPLVRSFPGSVDVAQIVRNANDVLLGKSVQDISVKLNQRTYWFNFQPYRTIKNKVTGVILALIDDTDKIEQRAKLADSEARYTALASSSVIPIYIKDIQGRYLAANSALQTLLGLSLEDILGKTDAELFEGKKYEHFRANDLIVQDEEVTKSFEERFDVNGHEVIYFSVKAPLFDRSHKVYATSGISIDITKQKNYAKKLELQNDEILRANQVKSDFLANMSHEIRTPLNAICGISEILEKFDLNSSRSEDMLHKLNDSAHQLYDLINDILDFSALEGDEFKLDNSSFDIVAVVDEINSINSVKADKKGIELAIKVDEDLHRYWSGDKIRVKQILLNVIDNGIKFTNSGSVKMEVSSCPYKLNKQKGLLTFVIRDTGVGVPPNLVEEIFSKFAQGNVDFASKAKGTGLGLSITKALLERMGGTIELQSQIGFGSTFTISIPLDHSNEGKVEKPSSNGQHPTMLMKSDLPILIVEDTETNIDVMGAFLELSGLKWEVARNGDEALQQVEKTEYALILMDLQMDKMDGFTVATKIRENDDEKVKMTPIIAVTGHAEKSIEAKCYEVGMQGFLTKPISLRSLSTVLSKHLDT